MQVVQGTLAILLTLAKMDRIPAFCPLSCFALVVLLANMALFRILRGFLEGFMGFVWVCLAWVLCVACGAFYVRVKLGGFGACCDFLQNLSFCPFVFLSCPAFVACFLGWLPALLALLLFWLCGLVCLLGWVVVSFSLTDYTQKERAQFLASSLRVLWVALSGCGFILLVLVRCQPVYIVTKFYI